MKFSRRVDISIFIIVIILLVGMLFWPFILNEIISQTSLVAWLLLRVFVLSIGQVYYWGALILVVLYFLIRFLSPPKRNIRPGDSPDSNATIMAIEYWRLLFTLTDYNARDEKILKRELAGLLLSRYGSKQGNSSNFGIYIALQRGEIPLPGHIHDFLFLDEPKESGRSFKKLMQSIRTAPQKWIRRWTGQETAELYRMIDEVLSFIETSLEIKNDDGKIKPNTH